MLRRLWTALATHLHIESVVMASPFHIVRDSASPRCTSTVHLETMFPRWSFWWITQIRLKPDMKHLGYTPVILKCSRLYHTPFQQKKSSSFMEVGECTQLAKRCSVQDSLPEEARDIGTSLTIWQPICE